MERLEANERILNHIQNYIRTFPDMRFGQALYNMGIATHCKESKLTEDGEKWLAEKKELQGIHFVTYNRDIFFEESKDTLDKLEYKEPKDEQV